ncbi:replication-associated recombination protein A [Metamycoplasma canadense]|uniref:ATPase n=1 Tax=Metamycoplasma canadense TaxID=29554 RepID=A0A077L8I4_9BACT|nr:replication-associated recombination protein A [Metamycoplasma canadense]BAP39353.1 ATPase [Metamycoplasma canadense]
MKINLANQLRPNNLEEFICSDAKKNLFESIIKNQDYSSFIFYGKPGSGKTTIAYILANSLNANYDYFNAAIDKKEDLITKIKNNNILIIDEIHRLNKDKQDILLPFLEEGFITIYATTTENPFFKLNPALRSRAHIIEMDFPSKKDIEKRLIQINSKLNIEWLKENEILNFISLQANGDFRSAINIVELIEKLSSNNNITLNKIKEIIPTLNFLSDKNGDAHYDLLSAFHKSLRGSDPDASLYWGLLILKSGNSDDLFRRMLCCAYEDVGLANPMAGVQTISAIQTFERLGLPEGYLPIGFAILNIALSPKSNSSYLAIKKTKDLFENGYIYQPPLHLKDAHYFSAKKLNRGINYKYPHDYLNNWINQQYMPDELINKKIFEFQNQGWEKMINNYWEKIKKQGDK